MAIELRQLRAKLNDLVDRVESRRLDLSVAATKTAEGALKARVFSPNGTTDVNGEDLGGYKSKSHAKRRKGKGRRTDKKDFNLTGDLQLSIVTGQNTATSEATLNFKDDESATIAAGLESQGAIAKGERGRKDIFSLSSSEVSFVEDQLEALTIQTVEQEFAKIFGA